MPRIERAPKLAAHAYFFNEHIALLLREIADYLDDNKIDQGDFYDLTIEMGLDPKTSTHGFTANLYTSTEHLD